MDVQLYRRFQLRVKEALEAEGISQAELARRMKVTPQMVSQYINGGSSPGLDLVERFAVALSLDDPLLLLGAEKIRQEVA